MDHRHNDDSTRLRKIAEVDPTRQFVIQNSYTVIRAKQSWLPSCQWDNSFWLDVEPINIALYMGDKPTHFPKVQAKLCYDDKSIYVIFRVEDRYVRAVAQKWHDRVCQDSCVEFFFTPGKDISKGYFNAEVNCGGIMLCRHQIRFGSGNLLAPEDCERFDIHTTLQKQIVNEITTPVTWSVEYNIPYDVLEKYAAVVRPKSGMTWLANLYKCADATSHPHWLTWSRIDHPTPKFHYPEFFGTLIFR
jgi:hypothetical protein